MVAQSYTQVLVSGLVIRVLMILYGEVHDRFFTVKYTDIDYRVFTCGAEKVFMRKSPFDCPTYRYTPWLAYLLVPNIVQPLYGKLVFSLFDLIAGTLIYRLVEAKGSNGIAECWAMAFWVLNPMTIIVSTRGNAESIMATLVLATLYALKRKQFIWAAFFHGLAIHVKLYPVIYLPSVLMWMVFRRFRCETFLEFMQRRGPKKTLITFAKVPEIWSYIAIALLVHGTTFLLTYLTYGDKYLEEANLFHVARIDSQHNFSPYFYLFHLIRDSNWATLLGLFTFVPQALGLLIVCIYFVHDLAFCWFLSTFIFVAFNKVCTSQYFLWYLCLLPPIYCTLAKIPVRRMVSMVLWWLGAQGVWLFFAYLHEFRAMEQMRIVVWFCSLFFFAVNTHIILQLVGFHSQKVKSE